MPGSPPRRIKDPGTIPPPRTLFNSVSFVLILGLFFISISSMFFGSFFEESI